MGFFSRIKKGIASLFGLGGADFPGIPTEKEPVQAAQGAPPPIDRPRVPTIIDRRNPELAMPVIPVIAEPGELTNPLAAIPGLGDLDLGFPADTPNAPRRPGLTLFVGYHDGTKQEQRAEGQRGTNAAHEIPFDELDTELLALVIRADGPAKVWLWAENEKGKGTGSSWIDPNTKSLDELEDWIQELYGEANQLDAEGGS